MATPHRALLIPLAVLLFPLVLLGAVALVGLGGVVCSSPSPDE